MGRFCARTHSDGSGSGSRLIPKAVFPNLPSPREGFSTFPFSSTQAKRRSGREKYQTMLGLALRRAATSLSLLQKPLWGSHSSTVRSFSPNGSDAPNPLALQMINYALSHARSQKSGPPNSHYFHLIPKQPHPPGA